MTKKVKAVFTVEAAAVMLLTILTIFSLMSLSLWLRERVILSSALTESLYCRNRQEAEQCLNRAARKLLFLGDNREEDLPGSAHFAPVSSSAEYHFHGERRLKWKFVIREN